ncbi:MAG TPA: (deoxy)nucleoside triphosphate pyrophosphohydrolase [Sphingomonas sp.]|nr:(deoxy)nucleoside triphosphate pyrophosphohydrolase [Sphingomonas sp.]
MDKAGPVRRSMLVVAAALIDADRRVLVQQRASGKALAGLWEFPGGKVEPGERPEDALARELDEELGIVLDPAVLSPVASTTLADEALDLELRLFSARAWSGTPRPLDAAALRWCSVDDLRALPMPRADVPLIAPLACLLNAA